MGSKDNDTNTFLRKDAKTQVYASLKKSFRKFFWSNCFFVFIEFQSKNLKGD